VSFVLVSLDPPRDSPRALRRFAREHHLDLTRWRLLAPSEEDVRDVAAVLGVRYGPAASGEIVHSGLIVALDRNGVVRHRQVGVGQGLKPLLDAVTASPN
jgi:protein SCO1/2